MFGDRLTSEEMRLRTTWARIKLLGHRRAKAPADELLSDWWIGDAAFQFAAFLVPSFLWSPRCLNLDELPEPPLSQHPEST
jgi:hypothetical protein